MLVAVKTPRTDLRLRGYVPRSVLRVLRHEYGPALRVKAEEGGEELVDVFETDFFREFKKKVKPGDYVRVYRENAGLSQVELADKLGVTRSYVCDIEHHRREISKNFARNLAAFFKISIARFL